MNFERWICSYRLWKDVTYYLKSKQLDKATESKSFLEQRQREGAKERAEKSVKWQTKVIFYLLRLPHRIILSSSFSISSNQVNKNGPTNTN